MGLTKKTYSEQQIIEGCKRNDRRFQEILYRQHFNVMLGMVRRFTKDDEVALDVINNGFLRVFQKIDSFEGKGSLQGWIRRIVYHCISDHFRKESKYLKFIVLEEAEKRSHTSPIDDLCYQDLLNMVEELPDKSKEVFKLFAIEGYTHKEIGELMNISEGTSKWYLSEARKKLQILISKQTKTRYAG